MVVLHCLSNCHMSGSGPSLPMSSCVTLGKLLKLSKLWANNTCLTRSWQRPNEVCLRCIEPGTCYSRCYHLCHRTHVGDPFAESSAPILLSVDSTVTLRHTLSRPALPCSCAMLVQALVSESGSQRCSHLLQLAPTLARSLQAQPQAPVCKMEG